MDIFTIISGGKGEIFQKLVSVNFDFTIFGLENYKSIIPPQASFARFSKVQHLGALKLDTNRTTLIPMTSRDWELFSSVPPPSYI